MMKLSKYLKIGAVIGLLTLPFTCKYGKNSRIELNELVSNNQENIVLHSKSQEKRQLDFFQVPLRKSRYSYIQTYEYNEQIEDLINQLEEENDWLSIDKIVELIKEDLDKETYNICPATGMLFDVSKKDHIIVKDEIYPCYPNTLQGFFESEGAYDFLTIYTEYSFYRNDTTTEKFFDKNPNLEQNFDLRYVEMLKSTLENWVENAETEREQQLAKTNLEMVKAYLSSGSDGFLQLEVYDL